MFGFPPMFRRPESMDDRHVIAKHSDIYPSEDELAAVQKIVTNIEKALKLVSDNLLEPDSAPESLQTLDGDESSGSRDLNSARILKGVMRVGILAKGLLLMGDRRVRLVMLAGCKPTATLLGQIGLLLPAQLQQVAPQEKYAVAVQESEASLLIADEGNDCEFPISVEVSLTSPLMREGSGEPGPADVLDLDCCLNSLAELRHAKWFQARAAGRQYCVMVIRILRDLCQRIPTWCPIPQFALELMVEKVLGSVMLPLSPGDALRRVFEALAAGLLLPDSPGLLDPCEKEPCDAAVVLTAQQRCDVTASAQHALRMIAFRQIFKVLGMEQLQPPARFGGRARVTRKRRRDDSIGAAAEEEDDDALGEKKKGAAGGAESGAAEQGAS
jgi:zinc finger RNA-binding protein